MSQWTRKLLKIGVPNMRYCRLSWLAVAYAHSANNLASSRFTLGERAASWLASPSAAADSFFGTENEGGRCCWSAPTLIHGTKMPTGSADRRSNRRQRSEERRVGKESRARWA